MLKVPLEMPVPAAVPSVQIIRAVLREYHAATHTAEVEPVLGPASLVGEIPVLMSCRPDLLTTGREVAVLTWPDVGGVVLGPYGAVPDDPPNAGDADTVDGIHASATATANKLLALNASSKLPASITGDADTVDGIHAAAAAAANKLLALDGSAKLPTSITGDADTVDSIHAATTPTANKLLAMDASAKFPAHTVSGNLTIEGNSLIGTGRIAAGSVNIGVNGAYNFGIFTGLLILELDSNNDDLGVYACNGDNHNFAEISDISGVYSPGYGNPGDNQIKVHYMTGYCLINRFTSTKTIRYMKIMT